MGWSNSGLEVVEASTVIISTIGPNSGIFVYSGVPATGNLVGSWTSVAGTDSFGNAYDAGLTLYSTTGLINISTAGGDVITQWLDTVNLSQIAISVGGGSASESFTPPAGPAAGWEPANIGAAISNVFGANTAQFGITGAYNRAHVSTPSIIFFGSSDSSSSNRLDINTQLVRVSGHLDVGTVDIGSGIQSMAEITANVSGITTTETTLMTIPSMTFVNQRAYRVTLWGLHQSTTADTYFLYRLREGTGTGGTIYKDQMRVPTLNAVSTNGAVSLTFILVNETGADITTETTWTGSCAAGTGVFAASPGNHATATIEDVGLASAWPGQPIS